MGLYPLSSEQAAAVTPALSGVTMITDRISDAINKDGRNTVAIDIVAVMGGAGPFDAVGVLKVLAGINSVLTESDVLSIPERLITAAGTYKMELNTGFPYLGLWYDSTSGGDDDTITATVTVS